ncbi:type II secretion system protein N [Deefgea tanakiae]|uniref:Type II secretion system protein N n=1 Tax=Deefgea tanakiae TaxID=2865840 RepID=A0ABX8Z1W1_9NEIS|nr:type II secretion system protein N [Deefgea tanakiae]QZA76566.1 type II secretion system protein N [Deefgea tanakiae]
MKQTQIVIAHPRRKLIILLLVVFSLVVFIARMPVSVVVWFLPSSVSLVQASGSIWDGRASALGLQGVVLQQDLSWQFEPNSLLRAQMAWQLRGEALGASNQARIALGLGGSALENVDITFPLEGVFRSIPKVANWGLGGKAQLRSPRLSQQAGDSAELVLDPIFSQLVPALTPITALRVNLNVVVGGANWQIAPAGASAIAVNGNGDMQWRGAAHGTINLKPDEKVRQQLAPLLLQVPATADGYQIKF